MNLSVLADGLARAKAEDSAIQKQYLSYIAEARKMPVEAIEMADGIFIPNDQYLVEFCGARVKEEDFGCYVGDNCVWNNFLIFPVRDIAGNTVGVAGFDPLVYLENKETGNYENNYYSYSNKFVFQKGYYVYCPHDDFNHALDDRYLVVIDGLFDAISLSYAGFNAAALMGSVLTPQILMQLRLIDRIVLIADNDEAGFKLYNELRKHLPNVVLVKQGKAKDADELLKSEHGEQFVKKLKDVIHNGVLPIETLNFF